LNVNTQRSAGGPPASWSSSFSLHPADRLKPGLQPDWKRQCAAVIPCFNEAAHIGAVVAGVQKHFPKVIVVDDGSTDATAEKAKLAGAEIISYPKNSGKGVALQSGWRRAHELGFAWALMLDGDGQHAPEDIQDFFSCAEKTRAPLVVGNRMGNSAAMPWLRRRVNFWMSRRLSKLTGVPLPDSQCGFRLAHLETLLQLSFRANRFEIESEMLVAFLAAGREIEFVPVQTIYKNAASKIRPLADGWRWLRWRLAQRGKIQLATDDLAKTFSRS
jgi:glycosyltransferase involved in cell wall biosynthesis